MVSYFFRNVFFFSYLIFFLLVLYFYLYLLIFIFFPEFGSDNFDEFLSMLGEKITLKGWERFRGGLDVKGNGKTFLKYLHEI